MNTKTMEQLVEDLRSRAEKLESQAAHLRQVADFLSEEYRLDGESGGQAPVSAPPPRVQGAPSESRSC